MFKRKFSAEEVIDCLQGYLNGNASMNSIAHSLGVDFETVKKWVTNYETMGPSAFSGKAKRYSKELKEQAVSAYLSGQGSINEICKIFKIRDSHSLRDWIKKYNGHEELKASGTGGATIMTTGRKTTFDERIEIVQYCIAHDHNYAETATKFEVSYQQARSYTVKYEEGGVEALRDRRGRTKPREEMSEVEILRAENKILRAEKERAEMEASFLKKLDKIERGWD